MSQRQSKGRLLNLGRRLRQQAGALIVDNSFRGLAHLGRLHPHARPHRHQVEVLRDVSYTGSGKRDHTLDIYRPIGRPAGLPLEGSGPLPVVLYVHGGGFRILSKDTHWLMGLAFARRGYVVFNINYRLAPRSPFPAGLMDCGTAYTWLVEHASEYGGDLGRLVLAGESAGANLVTSLAIASCYRRVEPWAEAVFQTGVRPAAVLPACGMLQVSDSLRFAANQKLSAWIADRLVEVTEAYLPGLLDGRSGWRPADLELADPLVFLERGLPPDRPLPPFFAGVGTRDPLLDDTRRLKAALDRLAVPCEVRYYDGEVHAFHALVWRDNAKRYWRESLAFLEERLMPEEGFEPSLSRL